MARKAEPGIIYYKLECDHIYNKKIRLLFNEFDSDGYWVWNCILSESYRTRGYYFDYNEKEALELFATDVCKKKVSLVEEVINGCVRRGLFDQSVFSMFGYLTSDYMQQFYLDATAERRRKGSEIIFIQESLLIKIPENINGVLVIPRNNPIPTRNNSIPPRRNSQSKVKNSKVKESIIEPIGSSGGQPPDIQKQLKKEYESITKNKESIYLFLKNKTPNFIDPFVDFWNIFAKQNKLAEVKAINEKRKKKFNKRIQEKNFDFCQVLRKAQASDLLVTSKWFAFDWLIENDNNYLKVIEGNYDNPSKLMKTTENGNSIAEQIKAATQKEFSGC